MECPYCGTELEYHDYFGYYLGQDKWDKSGDIYKCPNELCESEVHNYYFHDYSSEGDDELRCGYPC